MKRNFINLFSGATRALALGVLMMFAVLRVNAQATLTATAGTIGPVSYPTLTAAFNAINAGTHQGAITIVIGAGGTNEGFAAAILNQNALPANYTSVTIKPAVGTTPTIQGNVANSGVVYLYGATNVTIDGSNTAGGTTRDLTIFNTQTAIQWSACVRLGCPSALIGSSNNTFKNCNMRHQGTSWGTGISAGSGVTIGNAAEAAQSNNTVQNCAFSSQTGAVLAFGNSLAVIDNNWLITGNTSTGGFFGVQLNNTTNAIVSNNSITNLTQAVNGCASGVILSFAAVNTKVFGNTITNVDNSGLGPTVPAATAGHVAAGIWVYSGNGSVSIYNNFIADVKAWGNPSSVTNGHGIIYNCVIPVTIYHNSINMTANQSVGTGISSGIYIGAGATAAGSVNLRDNIIQVAQTTGSRFTTYCTVPSTVFGGIDYNDYVAASAGVSLGWITGTTCATLTAMQTFFGSNLNSIITAPSFVSGTNLHLQLIPANVPLVAGTPIPAVATDIDNFNRSTTTPTIGAHELLSKITYTALTNTCSDGNITLSPVLIESPTGIPTVGANIPRIYFRKGVGPWFSTAGTLSSGTATVGTWSFVINPTLMGGVTAGDIITYYVVAQTTSGTIFGNPSAGLTAVDVNTILTPPTTPNTYTVNAVTLAGLTPSGNVCFNSLGTSTVPFTYTGSTGAPNQYTLTWSPAGPVPVPGFTALPPGTINVTVPTALPSATYNGTVTIKNALTGCTNVYSIVLFVNPIPATVSGSPIVCVGSTTTLSSSSTGGTWTSLSPGIATIGFTSGNVNGVSGGTANIVYTLPTGCSTFTNINVVPPPAPIVGSASICPNVVTTLTNTVSGGVWSSSNVAVATVGSSTGDVTGVTPGTAVISYTLTGCTPVTRTVTVNPTPNPITGTLFACQGYSTTLSTTSTGGTWISSAPSIAAIGSTTGTVSGVSAGSSIITYQFTTTGCIITNTVIIYPATGPITGGPLVCQGLSTTLSATVPGGTWTSTLPGIVSVGLTSGIATGIASTGSVTISYILPTGCYTTAPIYISTPPTAIAGSHVFCSGYTITLTNGTAGGTWTSSNTSVATVGASSGVVSGIVGGTTTISYITAVCNPVLYAVTVNQTPPSITGVTTLCNGGSTTTLYNATPGGVWTISGGGSVSPLGVVTGLSLGTGTVVTYTMPNTCFTVAPITIDTLPAPITGIDSVCPGRTVTLHTAAIGGLWSSNNASIATAAAPTGVITGVTYGSTTITYTALSGCYRTKPFRVTNPLPASVSITRNPALDTLCLGVPVTFSAHPVNGGIAPSYQWQIFGVNVGPNDSSYTYTPTHGDVVSVYVTNGIDICSSPTPFYANIPINVYPNVIPVVNITTTSSTTVAYLGQVVTFNAEVTSGGPSPLYQWYVDGFAVPGATGNTFVRTVYDNDTVQCAVNGNPPCELGSVGNSNKIIIYADWLETKVIGTLAMLSLAPNPNTGNFTLTGSAGGNGNEVLSVEVVNVLGQVVFSGKTTANRGTINYPINLSKDIASGTYILRVNGDRDNKVFHFVVGK